MTYTVREPGRPSWEDNIPTLAAATASCNEAIDRGLRAVIVDDETGQIVGCDGWSVSTVDGTGALLRRERAGIHDRGGSMNHPSIMLPRDQSERRGVPALARLIEIARGDSGQCGRVRRFLLGLYNGGDFPFDLTDLRGLDSAIQEDALRVLSMDMTPAVEVHKRIPVAAIIADWAADAFTAYCPRCHDRVPTIDDGETCAQCKLVL